MIKAILTTSVLALAASAASAQNCAPTSVVYKQLTDKFSEKRIFVGIMPNGLTEVWGNVENKSWTVIITTPDGYSCVVSDGGEFEIIMPGLPT